MDWARNLLIGVFVSALTTLGVPARAQILDTCPLSSAPFVLCFDDITDGAPIVTANFAFTVGTGIESATVFPAAGLPIAGPFPLSFALTETVSDFNPPFSDVVNVISPSVIVFQSDIFSTVFPLAIPTTLPEDGGFQLFAVTPGLVDIYVRSDVGGPDVPEPGTLAVFLLGLASIVWLSARDAASNPLR